MNNFQIIAFVKSLKKQKDGSNNKTIKQHEPNVVQRTELPTTPNGDRTTVHSSIFKRIWG